MFWIMYRLVRMAAIVKALRKLQKSDKQGAALWIAIGSFLWAVFFSKKSFR